MNYNGLQNLEIAISTINVLQENAKFHGEARNVLWESAKFLRGTQYICERTQKFYELMQKH